MLAIVDSAYIQSKLDPEQSLKDIPKKQKQAPIKPLAKTGKSTVHRPLTFAYTYPPFSLFAII
jgi:putative transposase